MNPTEQDEADLLAKLATGEVKAADLAPPAERTSLLETLLTEDLGPSPGTTIH